MTMIAVIEKSLIELLENKVKFVQMTQVKKIKFKTWLF
jgi:hypothetical protein